MEGSYVAGRYLFDPSLSLRASNLATGGLIPFKDFVPDFADPYWLHQPTESLASVQPPTWLNVVGIDGYWPVAVINDNSTIEMEREGTPPGSLLRESAPPSTVARMAADKGHYDLEKASVDRHLRSAEKGTHFSDQMLFRPPIAWKLCAAGALLLLIYELVGIVIGPSHAAAGLFTVFRRVPNRSQELLVGVNSGLAAGIPLELMSIFIMLPSDSFLARDQWAVYVIGGLTLAAAFTLLAVLVVSRRGVACVSYCATLAILIVTSSVVLLNSLSSPCCPANNLPLFYRASHLTSGVSPLLPIVLLLVGSYLWTWQAMAGNLMLCEGRPILPKLQSGPPRWNEIPPILYRISEKMERTILGVAAPLSLSLTVLLLPVYLGFVAWALFHSELPVLSLESNLFAVCVNVGLLAAFLLIAAEALRLFITWQELRRLLTALGRLRLQRTFAKLKAVDVSSLWGMSGNLHRVQYLFFSKQMDAARRLAPQLGGYFPSVDDVLLCGRAFALKYAGELDQGPLWEKAIVRPGSNTTVYMRVVLADAVAQVIGTILLPAWNKEVTSLSLETTEATSDDGERNVPAMTLSENQTVRDAEEFVCFHYTAFIHNVLARMRTMTLSMAMLFVSVCFAVSFYPFVPRAQISIWLIVNLACIGVAVIYVYAGMERDETLSYITNTKPGHLSSEFWIKLAGFLAGPVIGIVTTQYPAIADTLLAWLQPGLGSLH